MRVDPPKIGTEEKKADDFTNAGSFIICAFRRDAVTETSRGHPVIPSKWRHRGAVLMAMA